MKQITEGENGLKIPIECSFTKKVCTEQVKPNKENPNEHTESQVALLADFIKILGWRYPIVVSNLSGLIVSGHCRWLAAKRLGLKEVPVDYQDFKTKADEMMQLLADNRIPELSSRNNDLLAKVFVSVGKLNCNLAAAGYGPKLVDEIIKKAAIKQGVQGEADPQMELQPYEHYDYIVLMFKNLHDWMRAVQLFGIKDVNFSIIEKKKRIGLGRVVDGARILREFFSKKGDTKQRKS